MIRRGTKKKAFCNEQAGTACHVCGAVGNEPCISMAKANKGLNLQLQNNHAGRKK